jgi:type I restriction enzyme, S subunit
MSDVAFGELYAEPSRNGVSVPATRRGFGTVMVNMRELFAYDIIANEADTLVPLTANELKRFALHDGDLLFARRSLTLGGAGKCVLVGRSERPRTFESSLIRVRLDQKKADPRFYAYYFRSPIGRQTMETIVEQVAVAGIRSSDLSRLQVPVPPLAVQNAIAATLGALDDKIACNSRISKLTESRLSTIFAIDHFDDPGGDSQRLDDLIEVGPARTKASAGSAPYIEMAAVPTDSALVAECARREPKSGSRFMNGDTIMARITPCLENGKVAFIDCLSDSEVGLGSSEFIVLRPYGSLPLQFAYFLARSERFRDYAVRHMSGSSGRQRCPAEAIARYEISKPDPQALSSFTAEVVPAFEMLRVFLNESVLLGRLRDTLMRKLFSGEVRARDVEKLVEGSV